MHDGFFNYYTRSADGWWERRDFLRGYRRLHSADRRWTPPYHPHLVAALTPGSVAHVDRQHPALIWVEALPGKPSTNGEWTQRGLSSAFMEEPVATAAVLADPRRRDGAAHLALLTTANDNESLERLLAVAQEQSYGRGRSRLVGPVQLSPHLGQGALMDNFNLSPPIYTPYNAPYLPEVLASSLEPVQMSRLYYAAGRNANPIAAGPSRIRLLQPAEIVDVLPKLITALDDLGEVSRARRHRGGLSVAVVAGCTL